MAMRSHVEPSLGILFLHVPESEVTTELVEVVDRLIENGHGSSSRTLFDALPARRRQILFHEHYHFWQLLKLPFLFRYALVSQRVVWSGFKQLSKQQPNWFLWSCEVDELRRLDQKSRISLVERVQRYKLPWWVRLRTRHNELSLTLSPIDLLECAATLAEYQYCVPDPGSDEVATFRRWANRNPSYFAPVDFLAHYLGDRALALRLSLPFINACFETTDPVRAFQELAKRTFDLVRSRFGRGFIAEPEPLPWDKFFTRLLNDIDFEGKEDSSGDILEKSFLRLTLDQWIGATFSGGIGHLFLSAPAKAWAHAEKKNPQLANIMSQPRAAGNALLNQHQENFSPPVTVVTVHARDGQRTILSGNRDFQSVPNNLPATSFKGMAADVFTMYSAIRKATGAHYSEHQRTCGHDGCPLFRINYCSSYPIIPKQFEDCGFAKRMDRLVGTWS